MSMMSLEQKSFHAAYQKALESFEANEVPVGAVIIYQGEIIAAERNEILTRKDPSAHAEILAIRTASRKLNSERLNQCDMYTTLEPCAMCSGAIILSRIRRVSFIALDEKLPAFRKIVELKNHNWYPHWSHNEMPEYPSSELLKQFFSKKRKNSFG